MLQGIKNLQKNIYDSAAIGPKPITEIFEVFRYRFLIEQLVRRDLLSRYKRSVLGIAWTMLNPLGMMLVMTIVFSNIFGRDLSYPAYLLSGLIIWTYFSQTTTNSMRQLIWGSNLIRQIYIPHAAFTISSTITGLINLIFSFVPLYIVILITGVPITWATLFMPVCIIPLTMFILGFGMVLATITASFPDFAEMYSILLRAWVYLTPIMYPEDILPESLHWLIFDLNPMYYFVKLFRATVYDGVLPDPNTFWISFLIGTVMLVIGWIFFTNNSTRLVQQQ